MTNASCADCGRIVAFRTHDPSEIAECRSCGTWVKRSAELPGVAVSVKEKGPVARKTAIPPRKDSTLEQPANPNKNITRSAAKRDEEEPDSRGEQSKGSNRGSQETLSAASIHSSIRDLKKSVSDLRSGQRKLQEGQKELQVGQESSKKAHRALNDGQKAIYSSQKQLFGLFQELQIGQNTLLERTLAVPEMPVSKLVSHGAAAGIATPVGPLSTFETSDVAGGSFYTTRFSSLKVPLIPIALEDLGMEPRFTEEASTLAIPAEERSDRVGLIEDDLPEPPPYVAPVASEEVFTQDPESFVADASASVVSPFEEVSFDDSAFDAPSAEQETAQKAAEEPIDFSSASDQSAAHEETDDPFLSTAAHESPFTIEGPPNDPFTIAGEDGSNENEATTAQHPEEESVENPFAPNQPAFGGKEYTHEASEIDDPFSTALSDDSAATLSDNGEGNLDRNDVFSPVEESGEDPGGPFRKSLSEQIAEAKESQGSGSFNTSNKDLLADPQKSCLSPILVALLAILALAAAFFYFFTDIFKKKELSPPSAPLVEFPAYGLALSEDDPRIEEAEEVAKSFLGAKTQQEVEALVRNVDSNLLVDFWEPMTAPTIEGIFQGRILENDRIEVDFLVKDFGREERLLPLIKVGEEPFQVDWKSFAECEEVTLLGLAQGTLILDSGEEIDEGKIRSWMQSDKGMSGQPELQNFQGFKLHNFTEEVVAFAVARTDSPEFKELSEALASTELKHKGKPAIRAVLKVKRIEKEDTKNRKPARLEILEVLSTNWKEKEPEDSLITEKLPDVATEPVEETQTSTEPSEAEEAMPEETSEEEVEAEQEESPELPPVPGIDEPLAQIPGETPLMRITFE